MLNNTLLNNTPMFIEINSYYGFLFPRRDNGCGYTAALASVNCSVESEYLETIRGSRGVSIKDGRVEIEKEPTKKLLKLAEKIRKDFPFVALSFHFDLTENQYPVYGNVHGTLLYWNKEEICPEGFNVARSYHIEVQKIRGTLPQLKAAEQKAKEKYKYLQLKTFHKNLIVDLTKGANDYD